MKKMLVKAVALSLVLGGVGFVANNAQAADIGPAVKAETGFGKWDDVLSYKDGQAINADVATNKANIAKNAENISNNTIAIEKEAGVREAEISMVKDDIKANGEAIKANSEAIKTKADAWDTAKKFAKVQEMFDNQESKNAELDKKNGEQDAAINANGQAIAANKDAIAQEKKDREHADQKLQDQITINKGQIENEATNRANEDKRIEAKFDGEVSRLDGRIDKLNDNVQKVGAMAAAIANLHTMGYDPEAPTEIAVGVGQYRDKTGMALGAFHYPNRDFMLSFSVSTAGDEYMGGIGATWKFGRKTPEELRQAEAEKAAKAKLAKAEAAKKAAKDARVAAQQKRHAEMLAARTGK